ncbi:vacuolar-processing enzyme beta-isozyme [Tanacetum coccineum]
MLHFMAIDVYTGVPKHYTGSDVNPKNFLAVLAGDEKAVGGKKVVKSTLKDHVFVYYAGHGGKDILERPTMQLEKSCLVATLARIELQERFQSMVLYVSACHSACVFQDYNFSRIYMLTSSRCNELSYDRTLYTIFGKYWMIHSESHDIKVTTLGDQFEYLKRKLMIFSNVTEIGNVSHKGNMLSLYHGQHYPLEDKKVN